MMTTARAQLVDVSTSRWYHCISRCVRQAFLLGPAGAADSDAGIGDRKAWIEHRLKELDAIFAVSVGGFAVLNNHLHLLLRLDPEAASSWTDRAVAERWFKLCPPRGTNRKPLPLEMLNDLIDKRLADPQWLARMRERLSSLSWFMKCLKEPLSRMVNKAEKCSGAFFEGRFKSIAVLDEAALLAVCAYIDLNPVAAGIAPAPEESAYTSVKARVEHVKRQGREHDLQAAKQGSVAGSRASGRLEEALWLIPIEDRRRLDSQREGLLEGFTLANYLMLVDCTGRMLREGKAVISAEVADILTRIGSSAEVWQATMQRLRGGKRLIGRVIASSREVLRDAAERLGVSRLANLSAVP
jgi:REP element-mobilizing transposase RayT